MPKTQGFNDDPARRWVLLARRFVAGFLVALAMELANVALGKLTPVPTLEPLHGPTNARVDGTCPGHDAKKTANNEHE